MLTFNKIRLQRSVVTGLIICLFGFISSPFQAVLGESIEESKALLRSTEALLFKNRSAIAWRLQKLTRKGTEGRDAVYFTDAEDNPAADNDALRLSTKVAQYPVEPVERLKPLFELGDPFLGNGPIEAGVKTPTGEMLQPWFLLYGSFRTAIQTFDHDKQHASEWTNRLDINGNLNLSGTERVLFSMRPLDGQGGGYTGYNFDPAETDGWKEDVNSRITKLFFEGDFGEIFPGLDPTDSHTYDIGFSVGRQRLNLQDGMLVNDNIDMAGITRNSMVFPGVSNLRLTGLYGWNNINRGNNDQIHHFNEHSADIFGLEAEADTALNSTMHLDVLYVNDKQDKNAWYVGASATQRFGWLNSTFRVNASVPDQEESANVGKGVLLVSQLSKTLHDSDNLLYMNTFLGIDRFTSAARGGDQGGPLGNLGVLFGPVGMGRYGSALGHQVANNVGAAVGYQIFMDGIDSQLIVEVGGQTKTQATPNVNSEIALGARYQRTIGDRHVLRLDAFGSEQEREGLGYGLRTEWMVKF